MDKRTLKPGLYLHQLGKTKMATLMKTRLFIRSHPLLNSKQSVNSPIVLPHRDTAGSCHI